MAEQFRFRPRFGRLAWGAVVLGALVAGLAGARGHGGVAFVGGLTLAFGVAYLWSPAWKYVVAVDDDALEVLRGGERRFRLPWAAVVKVVASPSTGTCFVDGGTPDHSLLVPGDGAPAPYDVERKAELYRAILAHVPADKIREVTSLDAP
ncbi:MAG TPA: hypothetical protein VHE35_24945 [Kofleriaceae bacterium]|nr:hypothetical protein [Kofleriaceae bacterium]